MKYNIRINKKIMDVRVYKVVKKIQKQRRNPLSDLVSNVFIKLFTGEGKKD